MNHFSLADVSVFNVQKNNCYFNFFKYNLDGGIFIKFFLMDLLFSKVNVILDHLDRMS